MSGKTAEQESIGVMISGRGSNLRALIEATRTGELRARVGVVISNRADAAGLEIARAAGIEVVVLSHRPYRDRDQYDQALIEVLAGRQVRLVCLAGFMRLLGPRFCEAYPSRVLNIHPSLLPAFPGVDAQRQAIEHGVKVTGATVHFVTPGLDDGPIVAQEPVAVMDEDTVESLSMRILQVEHRIYPRAVERVLHQRWRVAGRRVLFEAAAVPIDAPADARP